MTTVPNDELSAASDLLEENGMMGAAGLLRRYIVNGSLKDGHSLDRSIFNFGFPTQIRNGFLKAGICTILHLSERSAKQLLEIKGIGDVSVFHARDALKRIGLKLRGE